MSTPVTLRSALNRLRAVTKDLDLAQKRLRFEEECAGLRDSKIRDLRVKNSRLELQVTAADAEASHWQAKAEELVSEFVRTGAIASFTIRSMPGAKDGVCGGCGRPNEYLMALGKFDAKSGFGYGAPK